MKDLLFAYGTLRPGAPDRPADIAEALARADHLGRATARASLHWLGGYPAIVRSDADRVIGDVYRIDQGLWPMLDSYEGDAYVRERLNVILEDGTILTAHAYLARDERMLGPRIESGDFLA